MKKWILLALMFGQGQLAYAGCPTWPTVERFALNGAEVTDRRNGLVWARCSVGQNWDGSTCTGTAINLTHEEGLQHAASLNGWRLPGLKELASLADKGCINSAIDAAAFPATSPNWYWSSSPYSGDTAYAWGVHFVDGYVDGYDRKYPGRVRLVRSRQ